MHHSTPNHHQPPTTTRRGGRATASFLRSPVGVVCILLFLAFAVTAIVLVRDRLGPFVPVAFLAICVLMHFFHRGHGGHR